MKSCSRSDQAHIFAEKLEECDDERFLWILDVLKKTSFSHISEKLKESYKKYLPHQSLDSICSMCRIPAEVDIKNIRSGLISEGLLPHYLYKDINKATTTEGHQYALWQKLFCHFKSLTPKDEIVRKFVKVFDNPQFESLHSLLLKNPLHNFDCTCKRRKLQLNNRLGYRLNTSDSSDESNTHFNTGTAKSSESRNQDRIRTPSISSSVHYPINNMALPIIHGIFRSTSSRDFCRETFTSRQVQHRIETFYYMGNITLPSNGITER